MNVQYCLDPTIGPPCNAQRRMALGLLAVLLLLGMFMFVSHQMHNERRLQRMQCELTTITQELTQQRQGGGGGIGGGGGDESPADQAAGGTEGLHLGGDSNATGAPASGTASSMAAINPGSIEQLLHKYTAKLKSDIAQTRGDLQQLRTAMQADGAIGAAGLGERMDYALESVGGSVVHTGETRLHRNMVEAALRTMCAAVSAVFANASPLTIIGRNAPLRIIQPTRAIGECFGFYGAQGEIVLRIQRRIHVEAVSVDHIRREMAPSGNVASAPKRFGVYGLDAQTGAQHFFGSYEYRIGEEAHFTLQTFEIPEALQSPKVAFELVNFRFLTNHGNENYTCVYQVKVHGRPEGEERVEPERVEAVALPMKKNTCDKP